MIFKKKNKYSLEDMQLIDGHIFFLLKDLETNEYIEIMDDTLQNKTSKTDLELYKLIMQHLYNELLSDYTDKKTYQK